MLFSNKSLRFLLCIIRGVLKYSVTCAFHSTVGALAEQLVEEKKEGGKKANARRSN